MFIKVPANAKIGKNVTVQIQIMNSGNIAAVGTLNLTLSTLADQVAAHGKFLMAAPPKSVQIKPGKPLKFSVVIPAGAIAASYFLTGSIDPTNLFHDVNVANNIFVSSAALTVS